jgi:hypothetical protein
MAITEKGETTTRDELLAEIRRRGRRRSFEEMLGPEPDTHGELHEFLGWLEEQRRIPPRCAGDEERS